MNGETAANHTDLFDFPASSVSLNQRSEIYFILYFKRMFRIVGSARINRYGPVCMSIQPMQPRMKKNMNGRHPLKNPGIFATTPSAEGY
jgi:hypothetical protein